jgi:hypothetical protein
VDTAGAYAIKSSDGTTYATATTSGVAALWLARHKGSAEYVRLKNAGRLTDTLRWALQRTAWTPADAAKPAGVSCAADAGWDSKAYGAGIVHAARAVQVPLEEPPTTRSAARGEPEFPVSASLFHPDVAPEEVSRRLRHLLRDVPDADRPTLDVELATVYATDERVREAIDAIAGPADPAEPAYDQARAAIGASDVSTLMRRGVGRA